MGFHHYSSREEYIVHRWIKRSYWLPRDVRYVRRNTPTYDGILIVPQSQPIPRMEVRIEVKEEEYYWYSRTGNVVLDYLSAFDFKESAQGLDRKQLVKMYISTLSRWIPPEELQRFLESIDVMKYGKLFTCDAHLQLFYVENDLNKVVFCRAYNNSILTSEEFRRYIESTYRLRINDKESYHLSDTWYSAAYPVKPFDPELKRAEVNSMESLLNAWRSYRGVP